MALEKLFDHVEVLYHSSIRITGERVVYLDPFGVKEKYGDADLILVTHDHFDHFSPEDIDKVRREDTVIVVPHSLAGRAKELGFRQVVAVAPGETVTADGMEIRAVASYNTNKPNHPKEKGWVGYLFAMNGVRYYVAGDTDDTPEARAVDCDLAMVPIGGTYTVDAPEAARMVNAMAPKGVVPTHYGAIVGTRKDAERFRDGLDEGILFRELLK